MGGSSGESAPTRAEAVSVCPPSRMEASQSLRVSGKGALWGPWAWEEPFEQGKGVPAQG